MNFEDLIDKIRDKSAEYWGKIQESPLYNSLRERYETLPVNAQRGLIAGLVFLLTLFLLAIPYSYFSSSSGFLADFENSRDLIRSVLRASRLAAEASSVPAMMSPSDLKSHLQNDLATFSLLPEQLGGVIDLDPKDLGGLAPAAIHKEGVAVSLKKLNLDQVVRIGFQLQAINPSVKMAGIEVTASSPDPHYFDVLYKLVIFSLPEVPKSADDSSAVNGKGKSAKAPKIPPGGNAPANTGEESSE